MMSVVSEAQVQATVVDFSDHPYGAHPGWTYAVAVTRDGSEIVTGRGDGTARVWSREDCALLATVGSHTHQVIEVAVTPDGSEIITAGAEGAVKLWGRQDGRLRATLRAHTHGSLQ
jgi:WD40 repeat protein